MGLDKYRYLCYTKGMKQAGQKTSTERRDEMTTLAIGWILILVLEVL